MHLFFGTELFVSWYFRHEHSEIRSENCLGGIACVPSWFRDICVCDLVLRVVESPDCSLITDDTLDAPLARARVWYGSDLS